MDIRELFIGRLVCGANICELFLFRCEVAEAVERIFVSFAKAFKKPQDSADRRPSAQTEVKYL